VSRARTLALAVAAAAALAGGLALAQPASPQQPAPGGMLQPRPLPGMPPGHPQPGGPTRFPGGRPPPNFQGGQGFPGGRPPPGFQGGRPQVLGPDGRPLPHAGPLPSRPDAHPAEAGEEHASAHEHECPGHGPLDPPPPPNLWHGLLMVNNGAVDRGGFLNRLLFRYENSKDPCDPKNEPPPFLASLINFGVLAYILYRFGRKPLAEALRKRKQTIMADIERATKLREDASLRLDDYQDKLDNIEAKLDEVRAEYAAQAELEKKVVLAEAEERRVRMRRDAELRVEQEAKAARAQLLRDAVEAAVVAAEELLAKQITASDLDRMAGDYLKSVGTAIRQDGGLPHTPGHAAAGARS
jgi:F-type H+-transporting ATPase subunit b